MQKGSNQSKKAKKLISDGNRGKKRSAEAIKAYRKAKGGSNNPSFGKHWWTDGTKNIRAVECPEGFRAGKVSKKKDTIILRIKESAIYGKLKNTRKEKR